MMILMIFDYLFNLQLKLHTTAINPVVYNYVSIWLYPFKAEITPERY